MANANKGKPKVDKAQQLINERKAIQLRSAQYEYDDIAANIFWVDKNGEKRQAYSNGSAARKAIVRALKRDVQADAGELRHQELARIDAAMKAIWTDVVKGKLTAIDRMINLQKQRTTYISGLAVPERKELTGADGDSLFQIIFPPLTEEEPVPEEELKSAQHLHAI